MFRFGVRPVIRLVMLLVLLTAMPLVGRAQDEGYLDITKLEEAVECKDVSGVLRTAIAMNERFKSKFDGYDSQYLMDQYPCERCPEYERRDADDYYVENVQWRLFKFVECILELGDDAHIYLFVDFVMSHENCADEMISYSFSELYTAETEYIDEYLGSSEKKEWDHLLEELWWGLNNLAYGEKDTVYHEKMAHLEALYPEKWAAMEQRYQQWRQENGLVN